MIATLAQYIADFWHALYLRYLRYEESRQQAALDNMPGRERDSMKRAYATYKRRCTKIKHDAARLSLDAAHRLEIVRSDIRAMEGIR